MLLTSRTLRSPQVRGVGDILAPPLDFYIMVTFPLGLPFIMYALIHFMLSMILLFVFALPSLFDS